MSGMDELTYLRMVAATLASGRVHDAQHFAWKWQDWRKAQTRTQQEADRR